jgi:hypothetical protein
LAIEITAAAAHESGQLVHLATSHSAFFQLPVGRSNITAAELSQLNAAANILDKLLRDWR